MSIIYQQPVDVGALAAFIAELNTDKQHHVGYCGEKASEIANTLTTNFSDDDLDRSFAVAYKDGKMIGALGFDVDTEEAEAEIWGPFINRQEDWLQIAENLWDTSMSKLNGSVHTFYGFYHEENQSAQKWMKKLNAEQKGTHAILKAERSSFVHKPKHRLQEITADYYADFINLHDTVFPDTYYNGEAVIRRLGDEHKLFIIIEEKRMLGYVYVEGSSEFKEGNIEYIAVSQDARKKGIGTELLHGALHYFFHKLQIDKTYICVHINNEKAIKLYRKAGFREVSILNNYILRLL
ncbi:GNAT family N-acetyltransferase [Bacillus chungangensis]|uniref:Ribosomal protein S18 acetylase RimI-like enzyme n=1 Tax=Bacillus chungangensis TaxID=587633 RepID=A0ABT9WPR2_9BACI|nr:N-acetyltransferase [Bacillus chungangensis]MDQ0175281.1 ribosomal protein S18 acetylase RimI-like enzyme [Bacillus chungangensis]